MLGLVWLTVSVECRVVLVDLTVVAVEVVAVVVEVALVVVTVVVVVVVMMKKEVGGIVVTDSAGRLKVSLQ